MCALRLWSIFPAAATNLRLGLVFHPKAEKKAAPLTESFFGLFSPEMIVPPYDCGSLWCKTTLWGCERSWNLCFGAWHLLHGHEASTIQPFLNSYQTESVCELVSEGHWELPFWIPCILLHYLLGLSWRRSLGELTLWIISAPSCQPASLELLFELIHHNLKLRALEMLVKHPGCHGSWKPPWTTNWTCQHSAEKLLNWARDLGLYLEENRSFGKFSMSF